jgi:hypothetical protein
VASESVTFFSLFIISLLFWGGGAYFYQLLERGKGALVFWTNTACLVDVALLDTVNTPPALLHTGSSISNTLRRPANPQAPDSLGRGLGGGGGDGAQAPLGPALRRHTAAAAAAAAAAAIAARSMVATAAAVGERAGEVQVWDGRRMHTRAPGQGESLIVTEKR